MIVIPYQTASAGIAGVKNVAGNSVLTAGDNGYHVVVSSTGYVRLPASPAVGYLVRIVKDFASGSLTIQNSAAATLETLAIEGEWIDAVHMGDGDYRLYSLGTILRQIAALPVPLTTSRLVYDTVEEEMDWVPEVPLSATGSIVSIVVTNGMVVVTFDGVLTLVELTDFDITATLDASPETLTGVAYDHATRTISFDPIAQTGDSQTLEITVAADAGSTVLIGGTDTDSVVIPATSTEYFGEATTLNNDIVHAWKFEADASDSVGTADGTLSGTPPAFTAAKSGNGHVTTGTQFSQYASAGLPVLGNGTVDNPFSISFWFRPTSASSQIVVSRATGASNGIFDIAEVQISGSDYALRFRCFDDSATARITVDSGILARNTTYHVVATYSGSGANTGLKIYINGTDVSNARATSGTYTAMENLSLDMLVGARNPASPSVFFIGWVDELYQWTRELTSSEVTELYNSGTGKFVV